MSNMNGGPAFPVPATDVHAGQGGMNLRDWFAGMAMQGIWACDHVCDRPLEIIAAQAYGTADAMLAERCNNET